MALVETAWEHYGLNRALAAVDLPKSTWYYHRTQKVDYEDKYANLRPDLEEIARKHPEYGIMHTVEELRDGCGHQVNHRVLHRLHQVWGLRLLRSALRPKPSRVRQAIVEAGQPANLVAQLGQMELFRVVYTPGAAGLGTGQGDLSEAVHPVPRHDLAPGSGLSLYRLRLDRTTAPLKF